jgi:hypothetical protein
MDNDDDPKYQLLKAIRDEKTAIISTIATSLFVTRNGKENKVEINAFEHFANCKVHHTSGTSFGEILYSGKIFYYG